MYFKINDCISLKKMCKFFACATCIFIWLYHRQTPLALSEITTLPPSVLNDVTWFYTDQ